MHEKQYVTPSEALKSGYIHFRDIPVCRYSLTTEHEKHIYSAREFVRIYRDMAMIRAFEEMLSELYEKGEYHGVTHKLNTPLRLAIGEEAIAVGEAHCMNPSDIIFGTHRNHATSIAKALAAIEKTTEGDLAGIMRHYLGGDVLAPIAEHDKAAPIKELAIDYFLYGLLCEIFGKRTGFNRGLGGSAHAHFKPFGIYPNSASPAGALGLALGAALYAKNKGERHLVTANVDESALSSGAFHEALHMSCMDQIKNIRKKNSGLNLFIAVINDQHSMNPPALGEAAGYQHAARIGAGVSPNQLHAERVDGTDPMAVIDAIARKKELLERNEGPILTEFITYRFCPYSTEMRADDDTKEANPREMHDPVARYRKKLINNGIVKEIDLREIDDAIVRSLTAVCRMAADDTISPVLSSEEAEALTFSGMANEFEISAATADITLPREKSDRLTKISEKIRFGFDENGDPIEKYKRYNIKDAIFEAVCDRFYQDNAFIVYGNSLHHGGKYGLWNGMAELIPHRRFFNAPVSEAALVSSAIGYAMCGGRVCIELSSTDLLTRAGNEIISQLARWHAVSGGTVKLPVVIRVPVGKQAIDLSSMLAGIPGLKIIYPTTPHDMKGMLAEALLSNDPVIVFESEQLYEIGECFREGGVPKEAYTIPLGTADIKREGSDITILAIGSALYQAMEAATLLEGYDISAEIIDARSLVPFDYETLLASVAKTGRLVIVGDAPERASLMRDIASNVTEAAFDSLDAPPIVVGARNLPAFTWETSKKHFPQAQTILDAIHQKILPLKDYTPSSDFTKKEKFRRAKEGI